MFEASPEAIWALLATPSTFQDWPDQLTSTEGLRYELAIRKGDELTCRSLLTGLGALGCESALGDGHTVDVTALIDATERTVVRLDLATRLETEDGAFGVYRVTTVIPAAAPKPSWVQRLFGR